MLMPFGKYKGNEIEDIPDNYLYWLMSINLGGALRIAVERELDKRENKVFEYDIFEIPNEIFPFVKEIIDKGFQSAAMIHHPDHGGELENMKKLNKARYWLKKHFHFVG